MKKTSFWKDRSVINLIVGSLVSIFIAGFIVYRMEKRKNPELTVGTFLNVSPFPTGKAIITGMTYGIVFGFIDNAGLWFGMDALEPFLPGGILTKAGIGNTFSDLLGSFLGTFGGLMIKNVTGISDTPIWAESVGIVVGCLLGIFIPRAITGKN